MDDGHDQNIHKPVSRGHGLARGVDQPVNLFEDLQEGPDQV